MYEVGTSEHGCSVVVVVVTSAVVWAVVACEGDSDGCDVVGGDVVGAAVVGSAVVGSAAVGFAVVGSAVVGSAVVCGGGVVATTTSAVVADGEAVDAAKGGDVDIVVSAVGVIAVVVD
jgi:hypothetical protein